MMSESVQELAKALATANQSVKNPKKNANNPHFKNDYATLDSVIESYKNVYLDNGISVLENPVSQDGKIGVSITLLHSSGQFMTHDPFLLPPGKETAQGYGSSITYARRYALSAVMNIAADDDDDGNQAGEKQPAQQTQPITQKQVGDIKTKAMQFAEMRSQDANKAYEALNISDVTKLSKQDAEQCINKLDAWLIKAGGK